MSGYFRNHGVDPLSVSASSLAAHRVRMNVIANNLANVSTTRNDKGFPEVFRRKEVVLKTGDPIGVNSDKYGVTVKEVLPDMAALRLEYRPDHPDADENGYVKMPNVRVPLEMIDMIEAARAYEANITAIQVTKTMQRTALELLS